MAAIFTAKTALSNLSSALPYKTSLSFPPKVSRVCFTSASKYSEGAKPARDRRDDENFSYNADESIREAANRAADMTDKAKGKMEETKEKTREKAQDMKEKAKDTAESMKDRAREMGHETKEKVKGTAYEMTEKSKEVGGSMGDEAYDMKEKTKDSAGRMADKAKGYARDTKETTKDAAGAVADKTKEGTHKAAEIMQELGEKAKQTVQGAWGAAKETTRKIKETVVGKSDDDKDVEDYIEDHVKKPAREHRERRMDDKDDYGEVDRRSAGKGGGD